MFTWEGRAQQYTTRTNRILALGDLRYANTVSNKDKSVAGGRRVRGRVMKKVFASKVHQCIMGSGGIKDKTRIAYGMTEPSPVSASRYKTVEDDPLEDVVSTVGKDTGGRTYDQD